MDKKNTIIGVGLLLAAFAAMYYGNTNPPPRPAPAFAPATSAPATGQGPEVSAPSTAAPAPAAAPVYGTRAYALPTVNPDDQQIVALRNDVVEVAFSNYGGAIRDVAFLKHPAVKGSPEPYVFNQRHVAPILAFVGYPQLDSASRWELLESTPGRVVYRAVTDGQLEVVRTFTLPQAGEPGDPYRIQVSTALRNLSASAIGAQRVSYNLGTATLVDIHDTGMYLNAALWDGEDMTYVAASDLAGGGFFAGITGGDTAPKPFIEKPAKTVWASVKNQFFAAIYTPEQPGAGLIVRRVKTDAGRPDSDIKAYGVTGDLYVELPALEPAASATLSGKLYVGPKEYSRLKEFESREEKAMQFDGYFFNRIFLAGFFAPLLLTLLDWFHGFVGNWGWAIILTTLLMKVVTLPLTLSAAKSSKRMAKIQPRMKEINEKYADNPQKKQKATMELFKEAKVNPVGGCLPILITMPFFIGFFAMLQTSSELRFAEFLWVKDLASPDTVGHLFGIPINPMPLLMGISSLVQMQLMPTPSMDNMQAKMMKFMPIMFVFFCYSFGSGLALYWTISNVFTIGQQLIINRLPDHDPLPAAAGTVKNVTPQGKRSKKK